MPFKYLCVCKLCNAFVQTNNCETHLQDVHQILTEDGMRLVQSVNPFKDISQPTATAALSSSLRPSSALLMSDIKRARSPSPSETSPDKSNEIHDNVAETTIPFTNPFFGKADSILDTDSNGGHSDRSEKSPNADAEYFDIPDNADEIDPGLVIDKHTSIDQDLELDENLAETEDIELVHENNEGNIFEGQIFKTYIEFLAAKEKHQEKNYFYFSIYRTERDKSREGQEFEIQRRTFICNHSYKARHRGTGKRHHSYNDKDCPVKLNLRIQKGHKSDITTWSYKVTTYHTMHMNHTCSAENFALEARSRTLSDNELEVYIQKYSIDLKAKSAKVRQQIKKDTGKILSPADIRNARLKVTQNECDVDKVVRILNDYMKSDPDAFLKLAVIEDENSPVKTIKTIFFQPGFCIDLFKKFATPVLMDGTYCLTNRNWICLIIDVVDNFDDTKLCAWALFPNETKEYLKLILELFQEANSENVELMKYVMLDKDMAEIVSLHDTFPRLFFLICQWHCSKTVEKKIDYLQLSSKGQFMKDKLKVLFKEMLHKPYEKDYLKAYTEICKLKLPDQSDSMQLQEFADYLTENWHDINDRWAFFQLKHYGIRGVLTNNRCENTNMCIKRKIQKQKSMSEVVQELINVQLEQSDKRKQRQFETHNKTFLPTNVQDPYETAIIRACSGIVDKSKTKDCLLQYLKSKKVKAEEVDNKTQATKCTRLATSGGPCYHNKNLGLPCSHLIWTRFFNKEDLITAEMFSNKLLLSIDEEGIDMPEESGEPMKKRAKAATPLSGNTLKIKQRHMEAAPVIENASGLMKSLPDSDRQQFKDQLSNLIDAYNKGQHVNLDILEKLKGSETVEKKKVSDHGFGFSPRRTSYLKITGQTKTGLKRKAGKGLFLSDREMEKWEHDANATMKKLGVTETWTHNEFSAFTYKKTMWLTDLHMHYFSVLFQVQFPEMKGMYPTTLYQTSSYPPINNNETFLQIIHSGGNHWSLLTNYALPERERSDTVQCYDSWVNFLPGSKTKCELKCAAEWQACQLLYEPNSEHGKILEIRVHPCMQQRDAWNCGPLALCNAIAICFGLNPEDIVFCGDFREELLSMVTEGKLRIPEYKERHSDPDLESHFKVEVKGKRIPEYATIPIMKNNITLICDCGYPNSLGPTIYCDNCENLFHQRCALMGPDIKKRGIGEILKVFKCYNCRVPGDYSFMHQKDLKPDPEKIELCAEKIKKMSAARLGNFLDIVICCLNKSFPALIEHYCVVEQIFSTYDLNNIVMKKGPIFAAVKDYWHTSVLSNPQLEQHINLDFLSRPQLVHLTFLLVCEATKTACPRIWPLSDNVTSELIPIEEDKLNEVCQSNKDWSKKMKAVLQAQVKKRDKLMNSNKSVKDKHNDLHGMKKEVKGLILNGEHIIEQLNAATFDPKKDEKWVKEKERIIQDILKFNETIGRFQTTLETFEISIS